MVKKIIISSVIFALFMVSILFSVAASSGSELLKEVQASSVSDSVSEVVIPEKSKPNTEVASLVPLVKQGWFVEKGKAFFGLADGNLLVGNQTIEGKEFVFSESGELQEGWFQIDNARYYFTKGNMAKGTTVIEGKRYYFNAEGKMFVGWNTTPDGKTSYHNKENGAVFTGWQKIDGKIYCFNGNGILYRSTTVSGVKVDENGVATQADYDAYLERIKPKPTQPQTPPANAETLTATLDSILNTYGRSPRNIYDYVHDHFKYKYTAEKTMEGNALHILEYGTGACYNFASLTYLLFQRAGYDVRYVKGLGWQHHSYHCWIMAYFDGGWYYVDSLYKNSAKLTADDLKRIGYSWDESAYPS